MHTLLRATRCITRKSVDGLHRGEVTYGFTRRLLTGLNLFVSSIDETVLQACAIMQTTGDGSLLQSGTWHVARHSRAPASDIDRSLEEMQCAIA